MALPSAHGKKWTELEEQQLLNELEIDMEHHAIAENHGRTFGGIRAHIREMAYRMYTAKQSKEDIMQILQLTSEHLEDIIARRSMKDDRQKTEPPDKVKPVLELVPPLQTEFNILKTEVGQMRTELTEIKTEIKTFGKEFVSLKKSIQQMMIMMKTIYEFETDQ
jgi:predicted  nucleic acid-binding Zn-ribbon protein